MLNGAIRNNLIEYKNINHFTNKDLAKRLQVSERTIRRHLEKPLSLSIEDLIRWAEALNTEVEELLKH